jgi:hypothetical protein
MSVKQMRNLDERWMENILFEYQVEKVLASKPFFWYHSLLVIKEALYLGN